jgi:hypothetical protein
LLISLAKVDPLEPITPARPKKGKSHPPLKPTPAVPPTFATQQVQNSQNRRAATVLFTPRPKPSGNEPLARERQPSPTPQSIQPPVHSSLDPASEFVPHDISSAGTGNDSSDDSEPLETVIQALDIHSHSHRSSSGSPRAGPHSTQRKKTHFKPRGGAKDVWSFYERSLGRQICKLCQ